MNVLNNILAMLEIYQQKIHRMKHRKKRGQKFREENIYGEQEIRLYLMEVTTEEKEENATKLYLKKIWLKIFPIVKIDTMPEI